MRKIVVDDSVNKDYSFYINNANEETEMKTFKDFGAFAFTWRNHHIKAADITVIPGSLYYCMYLFPIQLRRYSNYF